MFSWIWMLRLWGKETFTGLVRNFWSNITILGLTVVCLLLFSAAYVIGQNFENITKTLNDKVEVKVEIVKEATQGEIDEVGMRLKEIKGVKEVRYISKEEGLGVLREQLGKEGSEVVDVLEKNPLPAVFTVRMENPTDAAIVSSLSNKIAKWEEVKDVQYGEGYVEKFLNLTKWARNTIYVITVTILFVTLYIMGTFIKLNIERRKEEIEIKKLTGAGVTTIRMPFILETIVLTTLSGVIVYIGLSFGLDPLVNELAGAIPYMPIVSADIILAGLKTYLFAIGIGIGLVGSYLTTQKYLLRY